ncbi:GerMN domain-containing protein [Luedemannella helvata]|uniref:GerMN domain-containing protein n=1 Tax=Luedemannella helvata TaxID=349315 RepID=A0ABN2KDI5_9ACTN
MTGAPMEDRLREALAARAGRVQPAPDALPTIRGRIRARRGRRRRAFLASAATLATTVAATVGVMAVREAAAPPGPLPDVSAATPATGNPSPPPGETARLPVYWIGPDPAAHPLRDVLYREFQTLPVTTDTLAERVRAAVTAAVSGEPLDPDYRSGWPAGVTVRGVRVGESAVTVDLAGVRVDADNPAGAAAVRQLVWTVTAASNLPDVQLRVDGRQVTTLWSEVPVGGTLRRADADKVLAPVWLISPQQGDTVDRAFDVQLAGFLPDGAVRVQLRDATGALVASRDAVLDDTDPHQGDAVVRISLPDGYRPGPATLSVAAAGAPDTPLDDHEIVLPG